MAPWVLRLAAFLGLVLLSELTALGQQEPVELQLKLNRGETLFYSATGSSETQLVFSPQPPAGAVIVVPRPIDVGDRYEGRQAIRVLGTDADGLMEVEYVLEDLGGELLLWPMGVKVRPDGRVVENTVGPNAQRVDYFPFALPGRPVRVGDSWTHQLKAGQPGFVVQGSGTFTLVSVEPAADGRVAVVRFRIDGTPVKQPTLLSQRARGQVSGEAHWSIERGRLSKMSGEFTVEYGGAINIPGLVSTVGTMTIKGTFRQELLAQAPMRPPVAPDLLIIPGRAIGAFSLGMSVTDISADLGWPEAEPADPGFRANYVKWPTREGISAFTDPEDKDKILGLRIRYRYRTEKGLGSGSSEGAILMAYGMSPVRLGMAMPRLGGVRLLIYNDQGIAFAITSDGTVGWITIFPPGGAAKIFLLP